MINKIRNGFSLLISGRFDLLLYTLSKEFGKSGIVPVLPFSLMIEPTNACNLRCPTCPTGSGKMERPKRTMNPTEFKAVIDQVRGYIKDIVLWNYGEPFLNRDLLSMIKYATSAGMHVMTSTNGQFFNSKEFCLEVVQSGLQHLIICLDGGDQETISKFRRNANFSEIVKGFRLINEAKKGLGLKTPRIELQFILMKHNEQQRSYIKELAKQMEVDVFSEKTVGINGNDSEFQDLCKELLPNDLSKSHYYLKQDGKFALKGKIQNNCSWVYERVVINSDGAVVPCCYDLHSEHIMGNIFKESLKDIWKNKKYQSFRVQICKDRKSIAICNTCSENRSSISKKQLD